MSKYDLPDLPSDDELGISEEDRDAYEAHPEERPELSKEEMIALLGETFSPKAAGAAGGSGKRETRKAAKKAKKAEKEKLRQERKAGKGEPAEGVAAPPPVAEGARSRWRGPVTLALLVGLAAVTSSSTGLPRPVPANAPDSVFSSSRAMSMLIEIARRPHPIGSPEHARVRTYLIERLRGLGFEPEVQTTLSAVQSANGVRTATVRNVIARLEGSASTGAVLITAHYDSRELAPGAGDDGAGVVAILEALRALRTGEPLRNDVIVLLTDAEEVGLLGARAFVDRHPWINDVAVVLSFEMRGGGGPSIMFETGHENGWALRELQELDPAPVYANSLSVEIYERMPNDTDFTPFKEAGKQGLNFAAIGDPHVYHQATDTPENVSESTLQHHGLRALAALRHFGGTDLSDVDAPNVVYFTAPLLGLVVYGAGWVLPITGGLVLLLLGVGLIALRWGARLGGVVTSIGLAILGAALSYGVALGLTRWVSRLHPEAGSLAGSVYHSEGWYVLATVAAVLAIVTALHGVARRWLGLAELSLGAAVLPFGIAVWASFAAPLAAMNFQWPVAAALLATLLLALLRRRPSSTVVWIASLLLVVPVFVFLVPIVELTWLSLSFGMLGMVAVLTAITLQLSLPALDGLRHPNGWWAPLAGVAAAAAALLVGVAGAGTGPDAPAPSTLVYAYEHGTGSAYWVTDPDADPVLDDEAIAWAEARAGAPFSRTADVTDFGLRWQQAPIAPAPTVSAAPPEVVILQDSVEATVRRVTLAARSRIGAEHLTFRRDPEVRTRFLAVGGVEVEQPGSVEWVDHWGVPDSMVVLELDMPADGPIGVHVIEDHFRPEELLGAGTFARPEHLAPDVSAASDRAIFRYSVAAFADPRHAFVPAPAADPDAPSAPPSAADSVAPAPPPDAADSTPPAPPPAAADSTAPVPRPGAAGSAAPAPQPPAADSSGAAP